MGKLIWIAAFLLMFWIVLWKSFQIGGNAVHLLVIAAVILIVLGFLKRNQTPSPMNDGRDER